MKKKLFTLLTLLLCLCSGAWAEDITITPTYANKATSIPFGLYYVTYDTTNGDMDNSGTYKAKANGGTFTITVSVTKSDTKIKRIVFKDLTNATLSSEDGSFAEDGVTFTASGNKTSVVITVASSKSGSKGNVKFNNVVIDGGNNEFETLTAFSVSDGTISFTAKTDGTAVTSAVSMTTTGSTASNGILTFTNGKEITFTSDDNIKFIAFLNTDNKIESSNAFKVGGVKLTNGTWSGSAKSVTVNNGTGAGRPISTIYVITEAAAPSSYTVTYNNNGGTGSIDNSTGTNITLSDGTGFTAPSNYAFAGWNTANDGSGTSYTAGQTGINKSLDLFATWTQSATVDANGGSANTTYTATLNATSIAIASAPTNAGTTLTGYFDAATGGNKIANADGTLVASTSCADANSKWNNNSAAPMLFAQWETATYTVTVAKNNNDYGTVTSASVANVAYNTTISATDNVLSVGTTDITATAADATAEYTYAFSNWTGIPEGGKVTDNVTVTANFTRTPNSYTLAWNANGDGATLSGEYTNGSTAFGTTIVKPTATREGYVLLGWSTTPDGEVVNVTTMPAAATTYYAQWGDIPNVYYYKDATHYSNGTYKNPEGNAASGQDNVALTTPWTIYDGTTIAGLTSVVATTARYDNKNSHMNSYIKIRKNNDESGKITFTIASGYKATIKIKMGGYSGANTSITMKLNDAGDNISYSGTMSGAATTEDGYALLTYSNLLAGAYTLKPTSGSLYISEINVTTEENTIPVSVGAKGYATYCNSEYALDFTDKSIKAFIAENPNGNEVTFTQVNKIAKGEPVLLYSETNSDSQLIPAIAEGDVTKKTATENYFRKGDGTTAYEWADEDESRIYVLNTTTKSPGFYKANKNKVATTKAYLSMPAGASARFSGLVFDGETTGISNLNVDDNSDADAPIYNLAGQKVTKSYRGVVIQNGKKMLNK